MSNPDTNFVPQRRTLQERLREKLEQMAEYSYSDGCVLFDTTYCTEDEMSRIRNSGILDTLARVLAGVEGEIEMADELLRQTRPDVAEFVERWKKRHVGNYNFEDEAQQAEFYEGVLEIARHIAQASTNATLNVEVSTEGVSGVRITSVPKIRSKSCDA
jgi:predicted trehalose synthase